jgi:hypothetical protein
MMIRPMPPVVEALPFAPPRGIYGIRELEPCELCVLNASMPVGAVANVAIPAKLHGVAVTEAGVEVWAGGQ